MSGFLGGGSGGGGSINIITSGGGGGGTAPTLDAILTQNTWYFDFVNGNDSNDGLTISTPIKTWTTKPDGTIGEYVRRTGVNLIINQTINYYVKNDMPITDVMSFSGIPGPNFQILVHGQTTILHTGTLSNVTHRDPANNVRDELFDGTQDWTPYVGMMVEVQTSTTLTDEGQTVSGPTRGWVAKAE